MKSYVSNPEPDAKRRFRLTVGIGVLSALLTIVGIFMLMRRDHDASAAAIDASTEETEPSSGVEAEYDQPASTPEPDLAEPELVPPAQPAKLAKGPMSPEAGLVSGRLPTPDFMRSEPRSTVSPAVRQGMQARTSRASMLNRRLEARIAELKETAGTADPESRRSMEHDIEILQAQLKARRAWESPTAVPDRR
jgi:hypothetical protein